MSAKTIPKNTSRASTVLETCSDAFEHARNVREIASSGLCNRITTRASDVSVALEHLNETLSRLQRCKDYIQDHFQATSSQSSLSPFSSLQTKLQAYMRQMAGGRDIVNLLISNATLIQIEIQDNPQSLMSFVGSLGNVSEKSTDSEDYSREGDDETQQLTRAYWNVYRATLKGYHYSFQLCTMLHAHLTKLPVELGPPAQVYDVDFYTISGLAVPSTESQTLLPISNDVLPVSKHPILEELRALLKPKEVSKEIRGTANPSSRSRHPISLDITTKIHNSLDSFKEEGQKTLDKTRQKLDFLDRLVDECKSTQDTLDNGIEAVAARLTSDLDSAIMSACAARNSSLASRVAQVQDMISVAQHTDMALMKAIHLKAIRRSGVRQAEENFLACELDHMQLELNSLRLEELDAPPQPCRIQNQLLENKKKVFRLLSSLSSSINLELQKHEAAVDPPIPNQSEPPQCATYPEHNGDKSGLEHGALLPDVSYDPDFERGQSPEPGSRTFADELNLTTSPIISISQVGECRGKDIPLNDGVKKQEEIPECSWSNLPFFGVDIP
ncbi:hypothetical protein V5O48_008652, partial [Marasmius crinis-equi]